MTNQTPIDHAAEALMKELLAGSRTLSPGQAADAAQTAYEAIDTEQLAEVISEQEEYPHPRGYLEHAQAVKDWLTGKDTP